ncbi:hypothetical protein GCM10023205_41440 [Yinghuangia aomiensis]|uniref:Lipoprotein n=1 Tax=Yinghuangia aomiensis TaxID=676205 RepID=A0ABP9HHX3_9ACTN
MMNRRRTAAVAGVAALGAFALTGCGLSKPSALVTMVSGTQSAHTEARCRNIPAGDEAKLTECLNPTTAGLKKPTALKVSEGSEVGIGVDTSISDHNWRFVINSDTAGPQIADRTYYQAFRVPYGSFDEANTLSVSVIEYSKDQPKNVWTFDLEKK